MAPILKEAGTSVPSGSSASPSVPVSKTGAEPPARPQPVALELPVTVNGARTMEGSDKREPFSESTQTVLVFAHGAVVRVATPLAPGQLIFLTNEKTRKEVVCQVVKTKSGGAGGAYVEVQFTEPAPSFWGLRIPGTAVVPAPVAIVPPVSRPAVPPAPASRSVTSPVPPSTTAPSAEKPAAPPAPIIPPADGILPEKPATPPPLSPSAPEPTLSQLLLNPPATSEARVPPPSVVRAPEAPQTQTPEQENIKPLSDAIPGIVTSAPEPLSTIERASLAATLIPLHDYSKEIDALFLLPSPFAEETVATPAAAEPVTPASSSASSEELKLQTARLQTQLSSLLFSGTPAASPDAPPTQETETPPAELADKVLELAQEDSSPAPKAEPTPAFPVVKTTNPSLAVDEEVKIPSWLAPLSQNSDSSSAEPASTSADTVASTSEITGDSEDAVVELSEIPRRPHTAVFGGHLLGESSAEPVEPSSPRSSKGIFIGVAAALVLAAGAGAWFYQQSHPNFSLWGGSASAGTVVSSETRQISSPPASKPDPAPTVRSESLASDASVAPAPQPVKSAPAVSTPLPVSSVPESKNSTPPARSTAPVEPPPQKPSLEVHLANPKVNRSRESQLSEPMPSIDTRISTPGADALAAAAPARPKEPSLPAPVGGDAQPAKLVKSVSPIYPAAARSQHISGDVQIDVLVDESGTVTTVKVVSGPALLHRAALDAVKQWKYSPAMLNGQATSMHLLVVVRFRAQ